MIEEVEKTPYQLQPDSLEVVRLAQVTDSHIFATQQGCLLGLNTRTSFEAVCQRLMQEEWSPDALLATGDLSQDASAESYQYLAERFKAMNIPTFWLPGNHDDPAMMEQHLTNETVLAAKQLLIGNWQVILLDSSVPGKVHGFLNSEQLDFLERALESHPEKHTLVTLHHQPQNVGCQWLDQIGLHNTDELSQLLSRYSQVKAVLWGHVHQEFEKEHQGIKWIATPSSCVQFKPKSEDFCAGSESPGYRFLSLYPDGRMESVVHRIDNLEYTVDYTIKGY